LQIGDPLIKIIPAYRHRAQSSSCSSTTSGGGQQISPRLNNACNGIPQTTDHFLSRSLLSSISPIGSNIYSNNSNRSASVTPLSGISSQNAPSVQVLPNDTSRHRDSNAMLLDPIQRTPLPPTSVDRAMMNAVLSQPLGAHTILDGACSPPVSSGRSSIVHDTPPPAAAALSSSKCDQPSNLEILASSASIVPLPSNMGTLIGSPLTKADISPLLNEKPLNNGTITTSPGVADLSSPNFVNSSADNKQAAPVAPLQKAVKRSRTSEMGDRPKRPRNNNKTSKSVKALLESVGPLISETVSDFQRERVSERDAAAAAAAASSTHFSAPSTSAETNNLSTGAAIVSNNVQTNIGSTNFLPTSSATGLSSSMSCSAAYLPSTSTTSTASTLVGVPLLRASIDRHHVSASVPSTSLGLGSSNVQHSPFPQSMEELLERQWEQGSHFLMSHAPFDIAQLLSCLHELKMENVRLEESMAQLVRRRDHLLALNARLSLSLTGTNGPTANANASPHHSPRIGVGTGGGVPQSMSMPSSSLAPSLCPASTSASSLATLSSGVVLPSVSQQQQQQQQQSSQQQSSTSMSHLGAVPSVSTSTLLGAPPYTSALPPSVDDSLNQLRSLAGGAALSGVTRNGAATSVASQLPSAITAPVIGRPASRHTPVATSMSSAASITGGTPIPQTSQTPFSTNRIPSTLSASGHANTTPTSAANASGGPSTTPKSSMVSGVDLLATASASTISPERQQQLAAAAVAAAAANALGSNFLTARSPAQISTSGSTSNPLGQFASQDLLTQYALLAQHQLLQHQAVAAAALSARYGGLVMPGNSTPPNSSSTSQNTPTSSHSGKYGHANTTPTSAANASGGPSTTPKSSMVSGVDLLATASASTISPERQQQLAAAAVAAAAANALGSNFLTARSPAQISTSGSTSNPLGQFASQDLLTQYALLAQHQLLQHQAVAAAALSARYGGLVMPGNSTPPNSSSTSQNTPTSSHSGK
ncbi:Uncharacterized protein F54F2.2, isoform a, partial [Toxocara canis]